MHKLPVLQIADPCALDFQKMTSLDDEGRVRFCGDCDNKVYNLSAMSTSEAETLLLSHEGKLCVRYVARRDGTIQTTDCAPSRFETGRRAARRVTVSAIALAATATAAILTLGVSATYHHEIKSFLVKKLTPEPIMMGEMALEEMGDVSHPPQVAPNVTNDPNVTNE